VATKAQVERLELARSSADFYERNGGGDPDDFEATITDLLADLLHLAHAEGLDPHVIAFRSIAHFDFEHQTGE
jgi:hypothetical protein